MIKARPESAVGPRGRAQAGRVPAWIPLVILLFGLVWLFDGLSRGVAAAGYERIDPRSSKLDVRTGFVDARWNDMMRQHLAALPVASTHDRAAIARIAASVAALPFVAEVGEPSVLWPDGVDVPLKLRTPAACVMQGNEFLAVAQDGVLLPGRWPTPPWIETSNGHLGFLPVIGPNDGTFDAARPGERLAQPRHLDALQVAIEMRAALSQEDFELLGPPLIDATQARAASVEIPGVVIQLEGRRSITFGRAPGANAVGERPSANKWKDVHRAALYLRGLGSTPPPTEARDWSYLDVRWETSDITWRDPAALDDAPPSKSAPKKKK